MNYFKKCIICIAMVCFIGTLSSCVIPLMVLEGTVVDAYTKKPLDSVFVAMTDHNVAGRYVQTDSLGQFHYQFCSSDIFRKRFPYTFLKEGYRVHSRRYYYYKKGVTIELYPSDSVGSNNTIMGDK